MSREENGKNGYNNTHKEYAHIKSGRRPRKGQDQIKIKVLKTKNFRK
jgi:hypothetical protein